jgi:hypothetical protein
MAPDDNNPGGWEVPEGYTLKRIPGHYIDVRGINMEGSDPRDPRPRHQRMPDGAQEVAHFDEDEPFIYEENDGTGQFASQEAKDAAAAGTPMAGWNPNVTMLPIVDGYVPDQYVLTFDKDKTKKVKPANVLGEPS